MCYALYEGGLFLLMLYNTLHRVRVLDRLFIKTLHSLEGLMIIDSLLKFFLVVFTAQCTLVHLRGLGIACRLSVCPSVTLVICEHMGWKSWKLIAQTISPAPSLFIAKRRST